MKNISVCQGNALTLFKKLKDNSVNLIIADPPYNLGKNYGNNHDFLEFDEYLSFSKEWLKEAYRVLKTDGTIYTFMGVRFISYLYDIMDREMKMFFNSWISWHYTQGIGRLRGFSPRHDDILMFNKSEKFKFNLESIKIPQKYYRSRNNMRGANPGDIWKFSHIHYCNENRQNHPTQKPEGLIERMILASSDERDTVLDPFAGTGTTLRVCQQLGRTCIGFELNPEYVDIINDRLLQPFKGFDSIDERLERVPLDLNDTNIRNEYLKNHINWFLKNHPDAIKRFKQEIKVLYRDPLDTEKNRNVNTINIGDVNFAKQARLFEDTL